ncbi:hypothetical protein HPB47_009908 [Ixodes persulcatus]|uniref:Uncharacterized protein n=1 Tax=Ixodes persulcatus TaxID=34615 RepID=A0AC60P0M8_IXOPE|nr:hypothetical protein HPB47_009908 [Ixodes persulcatus]
MNSRVKAIASSSFSKVFLAAALAVALPASSPLYDHRGDTPTWIHPPPVRVASDQPLPCPQFLQLTLAPNHLRIWQPGTTCDPREEGLQKPARSAPQLGHDIAAGTVMQTSRLLQVENFVTGWTKNSSGKGKNESGCENMHARQRKRHKIRQKLSYTDFAKNRKLYKCVFSCEEVTEPQEIPIR